MAEKIISATEAMALAIAEAKKGFGFVSPNPVVGCVILDSKRQLLACGYHHKIGGPHAEVEALNSIQDLSKLIGAEVYVTLEPCSHFGRTPPCAHALAKFKLKKLVYGLRDPNPKVSGQGAAHLNAAGIECQSWAEHSPQEIEILKDLEELAEIFLFNQRQQKVFVALKAATSLDGRMAMRSGESQWITGPESREHAHFLRAQYDAVLIGKRTFLADDPSLNIRLKGFENQSNFVVILDPDGETITQIKSSKLAAVRPLNKIIFATSANILSDEFKILKVRKNSEGDLDLKHLLEQLWQVEIKSIFVEGGAKTYAGFIKESLVNRVHLFVAPHIIGGQHGLSWTEYLGGEKMSERFLLSKLKPQKLGEDLYFSFQFTNGLL
jgi:diaminohydroxyphosphoribosylaminopyrimidine deaminase/5-amino-6-(5-phosphoribosylamino)uracil reductase